MTKLAATTDVTSLARMGDNITEINTAIEQALEVATNHLLSDLHQVTFDRTTRYDLFHVKHKEIGNSIYEYHWRLANGFVDSGQTFTVKVADHISDFASGYSSDITDECIVDYEKGVISVVAGQVATIRVPNNESKIIGNFVRVDYTSGFNADDNSGYYDTDEVPVWLKDLAAIKALSVLDSIDPEFRASSDNPVSPDLVKALYASGLGNRIRYFPKYDNPVAKS